MSSLRRRTAVTLVVKAFVATSISDGKRLLSTCLKLQLIRQDAQAANHEAVVVVAKALDSGKANRSLVLSCSPSIVIG